MSLSLRHEFLSPTEDIAQNARHLSTFVLGDARPCRIHGACTLVRMVRGTDYNWCELAAGPYRFIRPGDYWMEESVFRSYLAAAAADLASQGRQPNDAITGLYARFQIRDGLAVSRDWSDLDKYIRLQLPPGASIVALVGKARPQEYYSSDFAADQARAKAAGISLPGLGEQIVIDFSQPQNTTARDYVTGPFLY